MNNLTIINFQVPTAICCICGAHDLSKWGVPVSAETGLIIANESTEEWGGKPACESCWSLHELGHFVGVDPKY